MLDEKTLQQIIDVVDENDLGYLVSTYMEQHKLRKIEFKSHTISHVYEGTFEEVGLFEKYNK